MFKQLIIPVMILVILSFVLSIEGEEVVEDVGAEVIKVKVFIDSGHGVNYEQGEYPIYPSQEVYTYIKESGLPVYENKTTINFTKGEHGEMSVNWSVSTKLYELLIKDDRFEVMLDRENIDDKALSSVDRAIKANEWGADIRICIHAERSSFRGYFLAMPHEDFYLPAELGGYYTKEIKEKSEEYGEVLLQQLDKSDLEYGRSFNNGYYRNEYGYIMQRFSKHPVVVLEMDGNADWSDSIELDSVQSIIANSIYDSLEIYFKDHFSA